MNKKQRQENEKKLQDLFHGAPIAKQMGMRMEYNEEGQAIFHLPYNPNFDHALHGVHGGVFATMIDNAGWFTVAPNFDHWVATIEFSTRLHEPVEKEDLKSIGKIVRLGKRLASTSMELHTAEGRLVATGSGTFTVTSVPIKVP